VRVTRVHLLNVQHHNRDQEEIHRLQAAY
jgi:hypothetical protein